MAEFFGNLERLAADLYPYRWPIGAAFIAVVSAALFFAYRRGWHIVLMEHRAATAVIGIPVLAVLGFAAWDLGSPLFINRTVEEEFPFSYEATVPDEMEREDVEMAMATLAMVETAPMDEEMMPTMMEAGSTSASQSGQSGAELEAVRVKVGEFMDQDAFHKGSGTAIIYRIADGSLALRLEDLAVTNGPDLHVLIAGHPEPDRRSDLEDGGYVHVGQLKGNRGNQNYVIESLDLGSAGSVVIYCMPFQVVFSTATLQDPG